MWAILTYNQQTSQIVDLVASQSKAIKMPVMGEATARDSLSYTLLIVLFVVVFGYATVLMARRKVKQRTPEQ